MMETALSITGPVRETVTRWSMTMYGHWQKDADKNIWIGTLGEDWQCLNPQTGIFTTYSTGNSNLVSDYISSLCISCDNNLIIGTSAGMAFMDLRTGEITILQVQNRVRPDFPTKISIKFTKIVAVCYG